MILTRLGNKRKIANQLHKEFLPHRMRIEFFFGAGGSYFYLPIPKFSILNDADSEVTNLYLVLLDQKVELYRQLEILPVTQSLIKYWQNNIETDPVRRAVRFLLLSNFTYMGKGGTMRLGIDHCKRNLINRIEPTFKMLSNSKITNLDFREVLGKISFQKDVTPKKDCFNYLDPVYLHTTHNYKVKDWSINDTEDCFKIMADSGINSAMSEFAIEPVLDFASDYKMNVIYLEERQNLKNRRQEILITNYVKHKSTTYSLNL
ncbi:DNA adenine methylase [Tenacibaculum sp. 190524A02b]|uniref:DNA adenine methylase n=1 Tax=Tenacibaculum vairaonense TaxID=3137860 RepID=UPI0031FB42FF